MLEIDRRPIWTAPAPLQTEAEPERYFVDVEELPPSPLIYPQTLHRKWKHPTAFTAWGDEEHRAIARVVASGRYTQGNEVAFFEAELAAYHGVRHAICVNSGSSANLLAVAALFHVKHNPLKRGDRVLVPGFAWATTYAPLIQMGLDIVLADVGEDWNGLLKPLASATPAPALVMLPQMLGNPHMGYAAGGPPTILIEDCCESIGAHVGGKKVGTWGHMATLSFFYSHQLSAIEGGAIITDDDELAHLCRLLRNHGWVRDYSTGDLNDEYRFILPGYNTRMTEMHAAVGREQLKKLDKMIDARRANWRTWEAAAAQHGIVTPPMAPGANPFGLTCLLPSREARARVAKALRNQGIDCRPCAGGSFRKQPMGKQWSNQQTPMADRIHDCGLMIGAAPFDIRDRIDAAARIIGENL